MLQKEMEWMSDKQKDGLPIWQLKLDTRGEIQGIGILQEDRTYSWNHYCGMYAALRLHHLKNEHPEQLEQLLDEGDLLNYLHEFQIKAADVVMNQVEAWMQTDPEYRVAEETHNVLLQHRLRENLQARAEEAMRDTMIYR